LLKTLYRCSFLFVLLLFSGENLFSQSTEQELIKAANSFFEKEEYAKAMPLYSQLLSLHPTDPEYNYKYGASAIYGESIKKDEGIKYLKFASGKPGVSPLSYFFLGKVYHLNYQFNDAIAAYNSFKTSADKSIQEKYQIDMYISMCENGKKLLQNIKDITVIDKVQTTVKDFFRNYELDEVGGRILVCPEELLSAIDKKNQFRPLIFFPGKTTTIYFASYGNDKSNGKDLYTAAILPGGKYSSPKKIEGILNTAFDEDFPFMHSDGKTLYFCSKGHSSMGGYDVFKSTYSIENGTFSEPENLDFAINTPDDDIFYIADSLNKVAFFASSRNSKQNDLEVFKVNVQSIPINISLIQGEFLSEVNKNDKQIKINLIDASSNKDLGNYFTSINGEYVLSFPKGGRYKYAVSVIKDGKNYTETIDVPVVSSVVAYKQEIKIVNEQGFEKMIIINHFDSPIEGDISALAQTILKQKAGLEINFDPTQPNVLANMETVFSDAGFSSNLSNQQIVDNYKKSIIEKKNFETEMRKNSLLTVAISESKKDEALNKTSEAENLLKEIEQSPSNIDNDKKLVKASFLKFEAENIIKESDSALKLSYLLETKLAETQLDIKIDSIDIINLDNALASNSYPIALEQFKKLKEKETKDNSSQNKDDYQMVQSLAIAKQSESNKSIDKTKQLKEEEADLVNTIKVREKQLQNASKKEKPTIQLEINEYQQQLESQKLDIKLAYQNVEALQLEANSLASQASILKDLKGNQTQEVNKVISPNFDKKNLKTEIASTANRNSKLRIIDADIETIILKNPTILEGLTTDKAKIAEFNSYYKSADTELGKPITESKMDTLNEQKSVVDKVESEQDWVKTLDKDIANLEKEKQTATNTDKEKIQKKIDNLNALKSKKEDSITAINSDKKVEEKAVQISVKEEKTVADFNEIKKDTILTVSKNSLAEKAEPEVQKETLQIENSNNLSESQLDSRIKINENLVAKIDADILAENQLLSNTKSADEQAEIARKINIANAVKQAKEAEIESDKSQLQELEKINFEAKNRIITQKIDSNYVTDYLSIDQQPINDYEKTTKKAVADFTISQKIKSQIDKNVADIDNASSDSEKEKLQDQIQQLQNIFAEKTKNASNLSIRASEYTEIEKKSLVSDNATKEVNINSDLSEVENTEDIPKEITEEEKFRLEQLPPDDFSVDLINVNDFDLNLIFAEINYQSDEAKQGVGSTNEILTELAEDKQNLNKLIEQYKNSEIATQKDDLRASIYKTTVSLNEKQLELGQNIFLSNQSEVNFLSDESEKLKELNNESNDAELKKADNLIFEASRLKIAGIEKLSTIDGNLSLVDQIKIFKNALELQKSSIEKYKEANNIYNSGKLKIVAENNLQVDKNIGNDSIVINNYPFSKDSLENSNSVAEKSEDLEKIPLADTIAAISEITLQTQKPLVEESAIFKKIKIASETKAVDVSEKRKAEITISDERLMNDESFVSLSNPTDQILENEFGDDKEVFDEIKANKNYLEYFKLKTANDSLKKISSIQNKLADSFVKLADIKIEQANNITSGKVTADNPQIQSDKLYNDAYLNFEKRSIALLNARKADSLLAINAGKIVAKRNVFSQEDKSIIKSMEDNTYIPKTSIAILQPEATPDIVPISTAKAEVNTTKQENKIIKKEIESIMSTDNSIIKTESKLVPKILAGSMFKIDTTSKNNSNNILLNPVLPSGLVYMVQVGAFKNPITEGTFNSFSPVLTDKLSNGITRYIVGLFIDFNEANEAKLQIRSMGYKDAFVVAYQDGKRIQLANQETVQKQTVAALGNDKINDKIEQVKIETQEAKNDIVIPKTEIKTPTISKNTEVIVDQNFIPDTKTTAYYNDANAAKADQVEVIKGLFYTVQVGVYSKPVSKEKLFNISPLNSELLSNGFIRYTSGQFNSLVSASSKKDNIVNIGIVDAFITAYYNGKRISVSQAQDLINQNGNSVLAGKANEEKVKVIVPIEKEKNINVNDTKTDIKEDQKVKDLKNIPSGFGNTLEDTETDTSANESVEYRVLLGEFDQNIPSEVAASLLNIQYLGVNLEQLQNGRIRYTSNPVYYFKSANDLLKSFQEGGMNEAKIIAFIENMPATVEEAREFSGQ
jgi:WD40-like Beta Propeller Repeat